MDADDIPDAEDVDTFADLMAEALAIWCQQQDGVPADGRSTVVVGDYDCIIEPKPTEAGDRLTARVELRMDDEVVATALVRVRLGSATVH